jgi:alpha-L-fucosidase
MFMLLVLANVGAVLPKPTPQQDLYMDTGFSMFVHYGVNTYTNSPATEHNCVKRGEPCLPASLFHPTGLDTDQWAQTAVDMGAYAMCLTAKHEGGFALWPSNHTNYSILASPVPTLDVVDSFVESCRKYGLQPCFYESPVENGFAMNQPTVPDADAFVDQQIAFYDELLGGRYGHIERLWWDHYPAGKDRIEGKQQRKGYKVK